MAPLLSDNLQRTVNSAAYLTSSDNTDKPLRINIRQCQLLAKKASETMFKLDNFSIFLQLQDSLNDSKDTAWTPAVDGLCRVLENAEMLIEDCCCGDHWLEKAIFQGNLEETFAKILYEIEWHTSVLYSVLVAEAGVVEEGLCNGKLCLTDDISLKAAAKYDLASLLQLLEGSHVCDEEVCKSGCLAKEVEKLNRRTTSESDSPQLSLWVPRKHLDVGRTGKSLGSGGFGEVFETKWLGQDVAWKVSAWPRKNNEIFQKEIAVMAGLNHPHVTRVVCGTYERFELGIVMELMEKSLYKYVKDTLRNSRGSGEGRVSDQATTGLLFSIDESVDLMLQIAEGMRYIHNKGLAYRDLKSENILLQSAKSPTGKVEIGGQTPSFIAKIADFGLSKMKNDSTAYGDHSLNTGTYRWMAPEMFDPERIKGMIEPAKSDRFHPKKVDVWSFGVTCSEILCGETPYENELHVDRELYGALKGGTRPKLPEGVPQRLLALIQRCWDWNPNLRPKFPGICAELRFIKGLLLRGDSSALQSKSVDVGSVFHAKTAVKIQGPWGGNGGSPFCTGGLTFTIKQIKLKFDAHQGDQIGRIWYIEIEYDINGNSIVSAHGDANHGSGVETIKVDWPREYFTKIEGSFSMDSRQVINVTTLTLYTNEKRQYGPFGGVSDASGYQGSQTRFTSEVGRVLGFQGRVGEQSGLISIGCFTVAADE